MPIGDGGSCAPTFVIRGDGFMRRQVLAAAALIAACGDGYDGPIGQTGGIASVRMSVTALQLQPGATDQLSATALDATGGTVTGAPAPTWASSNTNVATVSPGGLVTGVAVGQADVTATISGKVGTTRVTVGQVPLTVTVTMPNNTFSPAASTIARTGTVNFVFTDVAHTVVFRTATGRPSDIGPTTNTTVARVFNTAGVFRFDCTIHSGMSGEVNVIP
jgi:plastocyanin